MATAKGNAMFQKFLISLCCVLAPMMVYQDLRATSGKKKDTSLQQMSESSKVTSKKKYRNKKKKKSIILEEDATAPEQDDDACEEMCIMVPALGFGTLAVHASFATEFDSEDADHLGAGMGGAFVGAAIGKGAHTCYRWCFPKKEKQD